MEKLRISILGDNRNMNSHDKDTADMVGQKVDDQT